MARLEQIHVLCSSSLLIVCWPVDRDTRRIKEKNTTGRQDQGAPCDGNPAQCSVVMEPCSCRFHSVFIKNLISEIVKIIIYHLSQEHVGRDSLH